MNLRKRNYFKPLCLLVAALFTTQCVSLERKLVSTEEKVIENESPVYVYELEKIKKPSAQDPIVEYRIVKFPINKVEIKTYVKVRKTKHGSIISLLTLTGGMIGYFIGKQKIQDSCQDIFKPAAGFLVGALSGGILSLFAADGLGAKDGVLEEIKTSTPINEKRPDSKGIPVPYFPLELKWSIHNKSQTLKTRTDEQGIVKINLMDDLKMVKFPLDKPLILHIHYLNPGTQKDAQFSDSLGPTQ